MAADLAALPRRTPVTVHLPPDTADEVTQSARSLRISRSELLRRLAEDYLAATPTGAPA